MSNRIFARCVAASAACAVLCGFTFTTRHITQAPVVDTSPPFYGTGLVIGPAERLPNVVKRVPMKMRMYKWLTRKGDTQYIPGFWREADCSVSAWYADLADYSIVRRIAHYENRLHAAAGLTTTAGAYAGGCVDARSGVPAGNIAGGRLPNGEYFGAGPNFRSDGALSIYRSDGSTLVEQHDVQLAPAGSNQYIGRLLDADVDGDGSPDLVVSIGAFGANAVARIAVLRGDGQGGFGAPIYTQVVAAASGSGTSAFISGFAIADVDGDGRADLVASADAGVGQAGIVWMHGNGDGTFAPTVLGLVAGYGVLLVDIDGNGTLDIATGDGHVLFGDGHGSFTLAPGRRYDDGLPVAGDFDGDGKTDLAILPQVGDGAVLHVWLGDGSGNFARVDPGYGTIYGALSADLVVTDLDGDGHADIVVGSSGDGRYGPGLNTQGQTQVLLGRGDGRFASPPAYAGAVPAVADFNGDQHADILATQSQAGDLAARVLLGDGHGAFAPAPASPLGVAYAGGALPVFVARDLDGDDKADLVAIEATSSTTGTLHVRRGNGAAGFAGGGPDLALAFAPQASDRGNGALPAVADFDGDGHADLAMIGVPASGHAALYRLNGHADGSFAAAQTIDANLVSDGNNTSTVVAADLDGDGKPDLVLADAGNAFASPSVAGGLRVYRNTGGGAFASAASLPGPDYPDGLDVGDVNGDGKPDIVVSGGPGSVLYVFLGNGDGTFASPRTSDLPDIWFESIAIGDADGDGKADLALGNCCGLTFGWFAHGDGSGGFAPPALLPLIVSPSGLRLVDLDGNGHPDLIVQGGGYVAHLSVHMNTWRDVIFVSGFERP